MASSQPRGLLSLQGPEPLPGFGHIHRHWDARRNSHIAKISPGEYYISNGGDLIATVLGSCIAACIRDVRLRIGGMNHFMLPSNGSIDVNAPDFCVNGALRYGSFAMEHLLNALFSHGARREDLEVKLFGGGQVMPSKVRIGERNAYFAVQFLETEGYTITGSSLGGYSGRKILYDPATGKALMKKTHNDEQQALIRVEQDYVDNLNQQPVVGEVELF